MRAVFRFSKGGAARYISHLDLMRAMNRAIRRAELKAAYSQGFHPHIVMSFAQALGLGYLSEGEYMEIALPDGYPLGEAAGRLNGALPEGIHMTGAWALGGDFPTLMAAVTAARWRLEFRDGCGEDRARAFAGLLERDAVIVVKEGRNGPAETDIRPGIYAVEALRGGVELTLAAGSARNIRPELAAKAALGSDESLAGVTRLELYATVNGRLTPLYQICNGESDEHGEDHTG